MKFIFIIVGGGCYGTYHSGQLYKAIQKGKLPAGSRLILIDRNARPPALLEHGHKPGFEFVQTDWQEYLQNFMADPHQFNPGRDGEQVQIVPAPYAPHLFFDWLRYATLKRLRELGRTDLKVERQGFGFKLDLPYEYTNPGDGNHFMSRAGWTCPSACIEPRLCPAVKGERDWDLDQDLRRLVAGQPVRTSASAAPALQAAGMKNGQTGSRATTTPQLPAPGYFSAVETFTCHHFSHGIGTVPALRMFEARERLVKLALQLDHTRPEARVAVGTVSHCHGVVATLAISQTILTPPGPIARLGSPVGANKLDSNIGLSPGGEN